MNIINDILSNSLQKIEQKQGCSQNTREKFVFYGSKWWQIAQAL